MRYLGLDLGSKTIGLALSDKTGLIATSYGILRHDNDPLSCLKELKEVIANEKVEGLVLGFPKTMNNTIGPRGEATLDFKKHLEEELSLPVYLEDERLTTKQAEDVLLLEDVSRKKRKKVIDGIAATIILQNYLDKRRK